MKKLLILLLIGSLAILPIILEGQEQSSHSRWLTNFRLGAGVKYSSAQLLDGKSDVRELTSLAGFKIGLGATTPLNRFAFDHEIGYQYDKMVTWKKAGELIFSQINLSSKITLNRTHGLNAGFGLGLMANVRNKLIGQSPIYNTSFHRFSNLCTGPIFSLSYRIKKVSFCAQGFIPLKPNFISVFPPNAIPPGPKNPRGDIRWKILSFDGSLFYYF